MSRFISLVAVELQNTATRKNIFSYLLFIIFFGVAVYGLAIQPYESSPVIQELLPIETGEALILDILAATIQLSVNAFESVGMGEPMSMAIGADVAPAMIITGPVIIALGMLARLASRASAGTLSAECGDRTLYMLVGAQSRAEVYLAKTVAAFLACTPMILLTYGGIVYLESVSGLDLGELPLNTLYTSLATTGFFIAMGMAISGAKEDAESAVNIGGRLASLLILLSVIWLLVPILAFTGGAPTWLELVTSLSPISLSMQDIYLRDYTGTLLQACGTIALLVLGILCFNRKDIDY